VDTVGNNRLMIWMQSQIGRIWLTFSGSVSIPKTTSKHLLPQLAGLFLKKMN
jgi:hypothetical protein